MGRWLGAILILAGVAAGVALGGLNPAVAEVDLLIVRFSAPLGMVLAGFALCGLVAGFVVGVLLGRIWRVRSRSEPQRKL